MLMLMLMLNELQVGDWSLRDAALPLGLPVVCVCVCVYVCVSVCAWCGQMNLHSRGATFGEVCTAVYVRDISAYGDEDM